MCLWLFGHRCWQYNPDLSLLFPLVEMSTTLDNYLESFFACIREAPNMAMTHILSVAYCRTRGAAAYPFVIVHLKYPGLYEFPVRLKLQGYDGPITFGADALRSRYCTPGARSRFSVAFIGETLSQLIGTWRYDVLHTMTFPPPVREPTIVDLLTLAELSTKWDHTQEAYPGTLFSALKIIFSGFVRSRAKAAPLPSDVAAEMKCAVINAFPSRRKRMQKDLDFQCGRSLYPDVVRMSELRAENAELRARAALLEETVVRLRLAATSAVDDSQTTDTPAVELALVCAP